jgi:hypothetical protein
MKAALRIMSSSLAALILLTIGAHIRHPYPCADCFEHHGFPFTYRQDGGLGGGGAFYPIGVAGDVSILVVLTALIAWAWQRIAPRR